MKESVNSAASKTHSVLEKLRSQQGERPMNAKSITLSKTSLDFMKQNG